MGMCNIYIDGLRDQLYLGTYEYLLEMLTKNNVDISVDYYK